jgi:hypothetical protein
MIIVHFSDCDCPVMEDVDSPPRCEVCGRVMGELCPPAQQLDWAGELVDLSMCQNCSEALETW